MFLDFVVTYFYKMTSFDEEPRLHVQLSQYYSVFSKYLQVLL